MSALSMNLPYLMEMVMFQSEMSFHRFQKQRRVK